MAREMPPSLLADLETLINYSYLEEERSFREYLDDQGIDTNNAEEFQKAALETTYQGGHIFGPIARLSEWLNAQEAADSAPEAPPAPQQDPTPLSDAGWTAPFKGFSPEGSNYE